MDPITPIVTTLAAGAVAGLKPTAEQAIKDAYAGIKTLIQKRYSQVSLDGLEKKPESEVKRASVAEDLTDAGAGQDHELLEQAQVLAGLIQQRAPDAGAVIGVDLEKIAAEFLRVQKVDSEGTGVRVRGGEFRGGIDIGEVRAGRTGTANP